MFKRYNFILLIIFLSCTTITAQDSIPVAQNLTGVLLKKEQSGAFVLHSNGWGAAYRYGEHRTGYLKRIFEIEFATMKHPKEIRVQNPYYFNARSYIYGKLNSVMLLRASMGNQHVLFSKPVWGGVEVRSLYSIGPSMAILKPVYLYILAADASLDEYDLSTEKYNPDKHFLENIYGRAPYTKGIDQITIKGGISAKAGMNFEYGPHREKLKTLEVGSALDFFPLPVEIMALNKPNHFFLSLYLSFHFGQRYNKFD